MDLRHHSQVICSSQTSRSSTELVFTLPASAGEIEASAPLGSTSEVTLIMKTLIYPASCKGLSRTFFPFRADRPHSIYVSSRNLITLPKLVPHFLFNSEGQIIWAIPMVCHTFKVFTKPGRMVLAGPIKVKCGLICPHKHIHLFKVVISLHRRTFDDIRRKISIEINDN